MPIHQTSGWPEPLDIMTFIPGRWYGSALGSEPGTVTLTANILTAIPIIVPNTVTVHAMALQVTTLGAGNVRLGIYKDKAMDLSASDGGYPDALVLDAGTVSVATVGGRTIASTKTLLAGVYWLAAVSDVSPVVEAVLDTSAPTWLGHTSGTDTLRHMAWTVSFSYAALPNPFTGGGALTSGGVDSPRIMIAV